MVEIEQSAQTLPPLNVGGQAHRRWRSWQELVVESLVVSLAMVVVDVLAHEETHVPFAEGDDATETLLFTKALFMTVWRPSPRSAENRCGIRQG